jgi:hypothetical protein
MPSQCTIIYPHQCHICNIDSWPVAAEFGGQGGIRTHGELPPTAVFKTAALNHSATCPGCALPGRLLANGGQPHSGDKWSLPSDIFDRTLFRNGSEGGNVGQCRPYPLD